MYLSLKSKLLLLCPILCPLVLSCSSNLIEDSSMAKSGKIVKIKNKNGSIVRFTDKYQRRSLKALPIVIIGCVVGLALPNNEKPRLRSMQEKNAQESEIDWHMSMIALK